jgi:penicillin-binding protein 2
MAVAYAAIANGGDLVTPHVGLRVEDPEGRTVQEIDPPARAHVDIDPQARQIIMSGLHDAAMTPSGTSYPVFCNYPVEIAGKTGTAERGLYQPDQSWYMALAPYDNPKYVVAVTVEGGGFGADSAAPVAKGILNQLFHVPSDKVGGGCDANGPVE